MNIYTIYTIYTHSISVINQTSKNYFQMSTYLQLRDPFTYSGSIIRIYEQKCKLLQKIRKLRGVDDYYPDYWAVITTYRSFIRTVLSCITIKPCDVDVVYDIVYMIAEKTKEVWPESCQKVKQIIDQYPYMSIRGWVILVYNFVDEIEVSINKQTTCGYELDYSNIVDVLTVNFRLTLPAAYIDFKHPTARVLSTTPMQPCNHKSDTLLNIIKQL